MIMSSENNISRTTLLKLQVDTTSSQYVDLN